MNKIKLLLVLATFFGLSITAPALGGVNLAPMVRIRGRPALATKVKSSVISLLLVIRLGTFSGGTFRF